MDHRNDIILTVGMMFVANRFEYDLPMPVLREDLPFCKFVDVDGQDRFQFSARYVVMAHFRYQVILTLFYSC